MRFIIVLVCTMFLQAGEVARVDNPEKPKHGGKQLLFEENLRFGGDENDDHSLWSSVNPTIAVDPRGHMFVAEQSGGRISEFNATGVWQKDHGGEGEGPGEFRQLYRFDLFNDGSGVAVDIFQESATFHFFKPGMVFDHVDKETVRSYRRAFFSPDGRWVAPEILKS